MPIVKIGILCWALAVSFISYGQRTYKPGSVLSSGNWFKVAIKKPGIYIIDLPFLKKSGIIEGNIPSAAIRLYGNGGQMLPESCSAPVSDDLVENAIQVNDGGDGVFNGTDNFLFYAPGPDSWLKDSVNSRFRHKKNLYSGESFYFITIGGTGKRIDTLITAAAPARKISSFNERYFYELDSINFLNSGKEWFGEEFASGPGRTTSRQFTVPLSSFRTTDPATLVSNCIARSFGTASRFSIKTGDHEILQQVIPAVNATGFDLFAATSELSTGFYPSSASSLRYDFEPGTQGAQGWLNWFELFGRRELDMREVNQLSFRDWNSVGPGVTGEFTLKTDAPDTQVWDVTDPLNPSQIKTELIDAGLRFVNGCEELHEYIAFKPTGFLLPQTAVEVPAQNLHSLANADMIIVTDPALIDEANRVATHHGLKDQLKVVVVAAPAIYNEFGSGSPDPTAIRDFIKMFYDKAGSNSARRPKYLLLFGDASYDYKDRLPDNSNRVPSFQSPSSLDPLGTYNSDDYFGFLDDEDDIGSPASLLDIGIGRVPARNTKEARAFVDKLIHYSAPSALGPWRNQTSFVADDEDFNLHVHDIESISEAAHKANPVFQQEKIYLDAYRQESNSSGSRYPAVNEAISERLEKGTLIWNYSGHGGFRRLAEEVVLDQEIVDAWNNRDRLPLFITATCDFAPYDNPAIQSLGENILVREGTGAIALMTTTRLVFAFSNRVLNRNYISTALQRKSDGSYRSLGEAVKDAKNASSSSSGDMVNNRKFILLGDPALTLAFPRYQVRTDSINGKKAGTVPDTLRALQHYTISGSVTDQAGLLPQFNGTAYTVVYDKPRTVSTLANDAESLQQPFFVQDKVLFKGTSKVEAGKFSFSFIVPQDISYPFGNGKLLYYAENGETDANGGFTDLLIGGSQGINGDEEGPAIRAYFDDLNFPEGGLTGETPLLIVLLEDSSGINIVNTGIDHEITAVLDGDPGKRFILNDFFETEINNFRKGTVRFRMPLLAEGDHTLRIKAWDGANNSSEISITFRVRKHPFITVSRFMNFPNPFTSRTTFRFDHDFNNEGATMAIHIYTVAGELVKTIVRTINPGANRSQEIEWDGKSDQGVMLHKGIYISRLRLETPAGRKAEKSSQMVILE